MHPSSCKWRRGLMGALLALGLARSATAQTIWLAPLAPYPPAGIKGQPDLLDLFRPDALWGGTASAIKILQLPTQYMAWVPDDELRPIIRDLNRRGIGLAIESLAQNDDTTPRCGQGVEGYGRPKEVSQIATKIARVGGALRDLAMDEPLYYGHYYVGRGACRSTIDNVAERVSQVLAAYQEVFPDVVIGDIEPAGAFRKPEWRQDYRSWVKSFHEKVGVPLAFLRLDIDWNSGDPLQAVEDGIALARENGLKLQIVYNGRDNDKSDIAWIENAKAHIRLVESRLGGPPDAVIFQSWVSYPSHVLPETSATTLTGLVAWYLHKPGP